ncbi:MAG: PspA/IM30 family protein [Spirochaetales bacterium]|nr:PspA/IM30 family protein [Spirochaetales bacterium]
MGFFDRIRRLLQSNINEMIDKAEDPQQVLDNAIEDMAEQMKENKTIVAKSIADEKRLERQIKDYEAQSEDWERKAEMAVQNGKDDLAKEALLRKQDAENYRNQYEQQWQAHHDNVEKLKLSLRQLQQKIDEAKRKKNLLLARAKRAEAQQQIQETLTGMNTDDSAFQAFDRMSEKVDQMEAEADAQKELDDLSKETDIEEQFKELESSKESGDILLEDLKQRMEKDKLE